MLERMQTEAREKVTKGSKAVGRRAKVRGLRPANVHKFVEQVVGDDMHARRVLSLANGVIGVIHSASLAIHAIGQALAQRRELQPKHAVKQVDRLLSNLKVSVWDVFSSWVAFVLAGRPEAVIALDWTEFDPDGQATIAAYLVTRHGRATPLVWKSWNKSELTQGGRTDAEDELLLRLMEVIPQGVQVTLLADRGFGDHKLYEFLERSGWYFVIRFRDNITVTDAEGQSQPAKQWLHATGRARMLKHAKVTEQAHPLGAVVLVHAPRMKDPWVLAVHLPKATAAQAIKLYAKRFRIEETFRDQKDLHFGLGLYATHIRNPERRDRLLLLAALAQALLTILGAAAEQLGWDRMLKVNTVKKRTHSLLRQGLYWYGAIAEMSKKNLRVLIDAFGHLLLQHQVMTEIFGNL